jgi:hypothetical protein
MPNFKTPLLSKKYVTKRLRQMNTMDQMQNVMTGMANIMGKVNGKLKMANFQKAMVTYQT